METASYVDRQIKLSTTSNATNMESVKYGFKDILWIMLAVAN